MRTGSKMGNQAVSGTVYPTYVSHSGRVDETVPSHVFDEFDIGRTAASPSHDCGSKSVRSLSLSQRLNQEHRSPRSEAVTSDAIIHSLCKVTCSSPCPPLSHLRFLFSCFFVTTEDPPVGLSHPWPSASRPVQNTNDWLTLTRRAQERFI